MGQRRLRMRWPAWDRFYTTRWQGYATALEERFQDRQRSGFGQGAFPMVTTNNSAARIIYFMIAVASLGINASRAQTTRIIPWNDGNFDTTSASTNAYHPEP